jgi:hypothetical protein
MLPSLLPVSPLFGKIIRANSNAVVHVTVTWNKAEDQKLIEDTLSSLFSQIDIAAKNANLSNPYLYLNYAYQDQDPITGYGAENVVKMQAISKKYDPSGLFQYSVPGGFKLFT